MTRDPLLVYALLACQQLVAGTFALSAAGKLRDAAAFAASLAPFGVPAGRRRAVTGAVIAAEAAVVPLIAWPATTPIGFAAATLLLAGFGAAILHVIRTGAVVHCRCFGVEGAVLRAAHMWRNGALALPALAGLVLVVAEPSGGLQPAGVAVTALAVCSLLVLVASFDSLVELLAPTLPRASRLP